MDVVNEVFSYLVFSDKVMQERLDDETYRALKRSILKGELLDLKLAGTIATAMKEWAIEHNVTHFTHWFQPMTGITAEKHDSFLSPNSEGEPIMRFSGKELIKGEPDASSFPSGGLRSTFEARGYTAWDPSSYAFIKDYTLCIPSVFLSYSGQILDKKTPLLRSMRALEKQVKRFCLLFDREVEDVEVSVGAEQEYFLISADAYNKRLDLKLTGRTLFGAKPPKGQELEDHYFGSIKPRVLNYMMNVEHDLWQLGVFAKTRHNESAPAQHELAPIYSRVSIAADQNQLTMEIMQKVAWRHGLVCLLHEKPFFGINGSGKHNNWSVAADGENLLEPGKDPETNLRFLLFLSAVLKAVDEHQDLLRLSVATAGNDQRLGSHEAPPAIISIFTGSDIESILESLANSKTYNKKEHGSVKIGVEAIADFLKDTSDRNRTSPFAFTGNKFEFRMLGSSLNISCPNTMINTAVTDSLHQICTRLENTKNKDEEIKKLIAEIYLKHGRIIFNGNNYSKEWQAEAEKRGLLNLRTTPEALKYYNSPKNRELFEKHRIYSGEEIAAREQILLENYCKVVAIEAQTMLRMFTSQILPGVFDYMNILSDNITKKSALSMPHAAESDLLKRISTLSDEAYNYKQKLETEIEKTAAIQERQKAAESYQSNVLKTMQLLRESCDKLELLVGKSHWGISTYSELLTSVTERAEEN